MKYTCLVNGIAGQMGGGSRKGQTSSQAVNLPAKDSDILSLRTPLLARITQEPL